ncbi:MAG: hypothetical protein OXQ90_03680 [Gammaproteobacteria bacterium]|nr:hypothetical protein [Gammaproteobacteria bacterium]
MPSQTGVSREFAGGKPAYGVYQQTVAQKNVDVAVVLAVAPWVDKPHVVRVVGTAVAPEHDVVAAHVPAQLRCVRVGHLRKRAPAKPAAAALPPPHLGQADRSQSGGLARSSASASWPAR